MSLTDYEPSMHFPTAIFHSIEIYTQNQKGIWNGIVKLKTKMGCIRKYFVHTLAIDSAAISSPNKDLLIRLILKEL